MKWGCVASLIILCFILRGNDSFFTLALKNGIFIFNSQLMKKDSRKAITAIFVE